MSFYTSLTFEFEDNVLAGVLLMNTSVVFCLILCFLNVPHSFLFLLVTQDSKLVMRVFYYREVYFG